MADKSMTIIEHLKDLRKTLIVSVSVWLVFSIAAYFGFRDKIFDFLVVPLENMKLDLVILTPFEGFMVKLKASFFAGIFFALPIILWQIWRFVLPGLYTEEKKYILMVIPPSLILFVCGMSFSYYLVLGVALKFLIVTAGSGFIPMLGATKYLGFVIGVLLPFGFVFQLPLVAFLLTKIGLITYKTMVEKRKYAIIISFILAAILTPTPDIITQSLMAIPIVVLYEVSILVSRLSRKKIDPELNYEPMVK